MYRVICMECGELQELEEKELRVTKPCRCGSIKFKIQKAILN